MEVTISLASHEEALLLFGLEDRNLKLIRDTLGVKVAARNSLVRLQGERDALEKAAGILQGVLDKVRRGESLRDDHVAEELRRLAPREPRVAAVEPADASGIPDGSVPDGSVPDESGAAREGAREGRLTAVEEELVDSLARSAGQRTYLERMFESEMAFCIGPAGTGKTFLAVQMAVHLLREGRVRRLILCRPAVEAGEKLGFLPGDFQAKINPYLRPLYDALNDILNYDQVKRYVDREIIEIIPLAYMRGRTLNHAFIILDEGQNTTVAQMKMFLTRMGANSRIVVNGDVTQIDLPAGQPSGLLHARKVVRGIRGISWVEMGRPDIVRHSLVKRIVEAYESEGTSRAER